MTHRTAIETLFWTFLLGTTAVIGCAEAYAPLPCPAETLTVASVDETCDASAIIATAPAPAPSAPSVEISVGPTVQLDGGED